MISSDWSIFLFVTYTHANDFETMLTLDEFKAEAFIEGQVKPIILAFVDGGPDENPRYPKVIENTIDNFSKIQFGCFHCYDAGIRNVSIQLCGAKNGST